MHSLPSPLLRLRRPFPSLLWKIYHRSEKKHVVFTLQLKKAVLRNSVVGKRFFVWLHKMFSIACFEYMWIFRWMHRLSEQGFSSFSNSNCFILVEALTACSARRASRADWLSEYLLHSCPSMCARRISLHVLSRTHYRYSLFSLGKNLGYQVALNLAVLLNYYPLRKRSG